MLEACLAPAVEGHQLRVPQPVEVLTPPRCERCGSLRVEVRDARNVHAWWHCLLCHDLPHIPLDWRVQWITPQDPTVTLR